MTNGYSDELINVAALRNALHRVIREPGVDGTLTDPAPGAPASEAGRLSVGWRLYADALEARLASQAQTDLKPLALFVCSQMLWNDLLAGHVDAAVAVALPPRADAILRMMRLELIAQRSDFWRAVLPPAAAAAMARLEAVPTPEVGDLGSEYGGPRPAEGVGQVHRPATWTARLRTRWRSGLTLGAGVTVFGLLVAGLWQTAPSYGPGGVIGLIGIGAIMALAGLGCGLGLVSEGIYVATGRGPAAEHSVFY